MHFRENIFRYLLNLPGWHTSRKIVVIESDDWGSIRMPSKNVYDKLLGNGFKVNKDPYLAYDSLASEDDLANLFEVLSSHKNAKDQYPKMTFNTIVANPDFKKIVEHDFNEYFYELFPATLKRYTNHKRSFQLWQEGIQNNLIKPQYHGREHLNVDQWMNGLRANDPNLLEAFKNEMISLSSEKSHMTYSYMEALDYFSDNEKDNKLKILGEGLQLFEKMFGYTPKSFMGPCFIWDNAMEEVLRSNGVEYIQGVYRHLNPKNHSDNHNYRKKFHYTGQRNRNNQIYFVRNVYFEPSLEFNSNEEIVDECLAQIEIAFRMKKPAIISSHRINFIGSIDPTNRDRNLKKFSSMISAILKKWPEVEFLSSDELGSVLNTSIKNK